MSLLKRIDYSCLQGIAGDWLKSGPYTAVILVENGRPRCIDGKGPDPEAGSMVWGKVIALRRPGANLIRVSQNFGGSGTLVRYGLASVVHRRMGSRNEDLLLIHYMLPASVTNDRSATALANRIAYQIK
jgi:hypothetical protein